MLHERRIFPAILRDLKEKMVFVAGPRQCGKTTLSKQVLDQIPGIYYSWDYPSHRKAIQNNQLEESAKLWVFDELHKYRTWRNWLKGIFDVHRDDHAIMVTGSAKLDVFRKGADSLQGRYYFHRMHPFTLAELINTPTRSSYLDVPELPVLVPAHTQSSLDELMKLGAFPEPLFGGSEVKAARWRLAYASRLVREEIGSIEGIKNLDAVELLFDRLPACVGSVLSINSLREDLEVSFPTVKNWIEVLERFYSCFRIPPLGAPRIKAVKKEQKLYMWDFGYVDDKGARFENLVALHLLRYVHWLEDQEGEKIELRYFRDVSKREVDFILLRKKKPWMAIEVKIDDRPLDPNLSYFLERVSVPYAFQISLSGTKDYRVPDINGCKVRLLPAATFLANLP